LRTADRFPELAVARQIDAGLDLPAHHGLHRLGEAALVGAAVVGLALLARANEFEQPRRPDQAADVCRQDSVHAWEFGDGARTPMLLRALRVLGVVLVGHARGHGARLAVGDRRQLRLRLFGKAGKLRDRRAPARGPARRRVVVVSHNAPSLAPPQESEANACTDPKSKGRAKPY